MAHVDALVTERCRTRWRLERSGPVRGVVVLVALVLAVGLAACSDGDDPADEALPVPGVTRFGSGDLSNIPLPFGARPIGVRSEDEGVVTQTFGVEQHAPAGVAVAMTPDLRAAGWEVLEDFTDAGADVYRGEFLKDGRRLEVSLAPTTGIGENPVDAAADGTQISLVLHPDASGAPEYTGVPATAPDEGDET